MEFESIMEVAFREAGVCMNHEDLLTFVRYRDMILEWNQKINLTRITSPEDMAIKHFLDSVLPLRRLNIPESSSVIDVGAGAGFPGIPLKIVRSDLRLCLIEASRKKADFLRRLCEHLGVEAEVVNARAEEAGRDFEFRERFDIGVARAVGHLGVLCEYVMPFLAIGGLMIAYKGEAGRNEIRESEAVFQLLGGRLQEALEEDLPMGGGRRMIIIVEKTNPTPTKYPRRTGMPEKRPLYERGV